MERVLKEFLSEEERKTWFAETDTHLKPSPETFMRLVSEMHIVAAVGMWRNDWADREFPASYFMKWMEFVRGDDERKCYIAVNYRLREKYGRRLGSNPLVVYTIRALLEGTIDQSEIIFDSEFWTCYNWDWDIMNNFVTYWIPEVCTHIEHGSERILAIAEDHFIGQDSVWIERLKYNIARLNHTKPLPDLKEINERKYPKTLLFAKYLSSKS